MNYPAFNRLMGLFFGAVFLYSAPAFSQCISAFPYTEDFEATAGSWTPGGTASDWAWGIPNKPVITAAGSGQRCWVAGGLTGSFYNYSERSYIESPCFDFTNVAHPYVIFKIFWESEHIYDGTNLQYSLDAGTTWTNVGAYGDAVNCLNQNWYNENNITYLNGLATPKHGWGGNMQATVGNCQGGGGSGGWVTAKHCMSYLAGKPSVLFRFTFGAGTTCNNFDGIAIDSVSITEAPPNTGTITYTCTGSNSVAFVGAPSLCPDTILWNFGDPASGASNTATTLNATHTFSGAGSYTVSLTLRGPCNAPSTITKVVDILGTSVTTTNVSCFGGNDGSATVTTTGGQAPYNYNWAGGTTGASRNNLPAGTYTVTVTDAQSCPATATATITQPASALSATVAVTNATCAGNDGSLQTSVTGGSSPYAYNWGGGVVAPNRTGLGSGTYTVTVTDSKNCVTTVTGTVSAISSTINISPTATNSLCTGNTGSVNITVSGTSGAVSYNWSNGATTQNIAMLNAGVYSVTVKDASGCSATASATVAQTNAPQTSAVANQITCHGAANGSIVLTVSGGTPGYTYNWSNSQTTQNISALTGGTYTVTVHDTQNCSASALATITDPAAISIILSKQDEKCFGDANANVNSIVSGGAGLYIYVWSNGATTGNIASLIINTYTLTVTDQNACTATASVTLNQPQQLISLLAATDVQCFSQNNGAINQSITGGTMPYQFHWSNNGVTQNISTLQAGSYTVTVTDANLCTASSTATINQPTAIVLNGLVTNASCFGANDGSVNLNASGGTPVYTYVWSNNSTSQSISNVTNGSYTVTVADSKNCTQSKIFVVGSPPAINIFPSVTPVSCFGGANGNIHLTVNGGTGPYSFLWSDYTTGPADTALNAGNYSVTITDNANCSAVASGINISQPTAVAAQISSTPQSCINKIDGSVTVIPNGGMPPYVYSWSNGVYTASAVNLLYGPYSITIADANGCVYTDSVTVPLQPAMLITDSAQQPFCPTVHSGEILLSVSGGTAPYIYNWSNGQNSMDIENLPAGAFYVTVTDSKGCSVEDSFFLQYQYDITVDAGPDVTINLGQNTVLTAVTLATTSVSYFWFPSSGIICNTCESTDAAPVKTLWYTVTVTDEHGCKANDSVLITVNPDYGLFIPNAFTPNGDGNNDFFEMFGNKQAIQYWNIKVFDRWGELVFESNDLNFKWDGSYRGKMLNPTVLVYTAKAVFLDGYTRNDLKGSLTLIR
jgi:gliding motility-associated-like protein